jgi:hypothetical protein
MPYAPKQETTGLHLYNCIELVYLPAWVFYGFRVALNSKKMKLHIYCLSAILCFGLSLPVSGQIFKDKKNRKDRSRFEMKDTFHFTVLPSNLWNEPDLNIQLNPYYFELYGLNINMGYDAWAQYNHDWLNVWASFKGSYLELVNKNTVDEKNSLGGPAISPMSLQNFEIGLEDNLFSKTEESEELINIGNFGGYGFSRNIKTKYRLDYGLRLGFQYFQTYVSGDQIHFAGYYINDPEKKIVNFGLGQVGTNMQENIINIGGSATFSHDYQMDNPTLGTRGIHYRTYLYGDIMFAPEIVYTNIIMKNYPNISREPYTDFNVNTGTPKSRIGARVGFKYYSLKPLGLSFGLELGARPGPSFADGIYGMLKFGVAVNARLAKKRNYKLKRDNGAVPYFK